MSYQILVLDLDGTLTNSQKEITPPTRKALIEIQQQGKKVVLASGRPPQGIIPLAKQLQLHEYGSYILAFNGGQIIDCRTGSLIYNRLLPTGITETVYELARQYDVDIVAYTDGELLSGLNCNEYTERESFINHMPIKKVVDFCRDIPARNNKFLITGDPDVISQAEPAFKRHLRSALNIYCSDRFFLEIMPPRIDKAYSLQKLLSSMGLSADTMICCGDGHNDITMIESAGLGVAMENAQPLVLEQADYITKSNDDDGVLHVINQFMR